MARNQQIRNIRIRVETVGSTEATTKLRELDKSITDVSASSANFVGVSGRLNASLSTLATTGEKLGTSAASLKTFASALLSINRSLSGSDIQTAGIDRYITNMEVLISVLDDVRLSANQVEGALEGIDAHTGMSRLLGVLEKIEQNTQRLDYHISEVERAVERTSEEFIDYSNAANRAGRSNTNFSNSSEQATAAMRQSTRATNNQTRSFSALAFGANPLVSAYAAIAVNIYAVTAAFRLLTEAANFERLKTQTASFSSAVSGINVKRLARDMQEASAGALTLQESLKFATKGVAFDFGAKQLKDLTIGARKASIALGINFSDAMDRVLRGISKQEIELFDELGVVTRLTTAFENYTKKVGGSVEALTAYQRQVALTEEVQRQLDERFSGINLDTTGWEMLGVAVSDFSTRTLGNLSIALESTALDLANFLGALSGPQTAAEAAAESLDIFNRSMKVGNVIQAGVAMKEYSEILKEVEQANKDLAQVEKEGGEAALALIKDREAQVDSVKNVTYAIVGLTAATLLFFKTAIAGAAVASAAAAYGFIGKAVVSLITILSTLTAVALPATTIAAAATVAPLVGVSSAAAGLGVSATVAAVGTATLTAGLISARIAALAFMTTGIGLAIAGIAYGVAYFAEQMVGAAQDTTLSAEESAAAVKLMSKELGLAGYEAKNFGEENGKAFSPEAALAWLNNVKVSTGAIAKIKNELKATQTPLEKMVFQFRELGTIPEGLDDTTQAVKDIGEILKSNIDDGTIPENTKDMLDFAASLEEVGKKSNYFNKNFSTELKIDGILRAGEAGLDLILVEKELKAVSEERDRSQGIAQSTYSVQQKEDLEKRVKILAAQRAAIVLDNTKKRLADELSFSQLKEMDTLKQITTQESKLLELGIKQLKVRALSLSGTTEGENLEKKIKYLEQGLKVQTDLEAKTRAINAMQQSSANLELTKAQATSNVAIVAIQQKQLALKIAQELQKPESDSRDHALQMLNFEKLSLDNALKMARAKDQGLILDQESAAIQKLLASAGSEKDRVLEKQLLLDIERDRIALMTDEIAKKQALALLEQDQTALNKESKAAPFKDASSTFSAMAALDGITETQSAGLGLASTFSDAFAGAAEAGMEGFSGFTEFLSGNMEAFQGFAQGVADGIGSVYQASSDARVAGIDQEIAAEKKRDGKSAESLAKIKSLEKKKIKEQAKAQKASVVISTATAIAKSFAELGFIAGIPAAAMMAGMGILQIAAINKAANGQISNLDSGASGGSNMKIEGGSRRNDVDVSRNANAGELSFINGGQGQGTANNFRIPGRAGGGTSGAGASIIVGERGAEEITPLVPVNVSPAGSAKSGGGGIVFSPVFNVEAMDSAGFEAVTSRFSVELYNSLETELRARNLTLDSLA
jgi:hypothetical protein